MIFNASSDRTHQIKSNATIWNWYLIFLTTNVHHRMRMLNNNEILAGLTVCRSTICQVSLREFKQKAHVTFFYRAEQYVRYTAGTTNIFWFGTQSKWAGFVGSGCLITLRYKVWNVLWNWLHFKPNYLCTHIAQLSAGCVRKMLFL